MINHSEADPRPVLTVGRLIGVVVVAMLLPLAIAAGVFVAGGGAADEHLASEAAPLDLQTVPPTIAEHYRFAAAHEDQLRNVPCFCGCEEFLSHRDLFDCFVRADGAGWDAHAAGCGVCLGEAITARTLLEGGSTPDEARLAVIEKFGAVPITAPPL